MNLIDDLLNNTRLSVLDLSLLIGYAVVCIGIGFWSSRKQSNDDFMIAGRTLKLGGFITSVVASYIGGAAIVAYTAYVYDFGISAIAVFVGTSAGFLIFIPYALKLRKISSEKRFITLSDWFYDKYDKKVGFLSALILFIVYFGMLLNQFIAGSSILASISGWSYETALLFSSIIIAIYLVAGGFKSVIKTDIFQYIVLFVLFVFLGFILADKEKMTLVEIVDFSQMDPAMTIAFVVFGIFIIFQSSEYWQRVYAAGSTNIVKKGLIGSAILSVVTGFAITLIGLAAHHHLPGIDAKDAFAEGLKILMPVSLTGASLVLIFAAIMSSADTQIFVLASSVSIDFVGKFSKKELTQKQLMKRTRLFIILFSLLGFAFAYSFRDLVAVFIFIIGIGFTIIPAAIASFHFKISGKAATASFLSGILYVLILTVMASLQQEPLSYFKQNADLTILSILISTVTLIVFHKFVFRTPKKQGNE